MKNKLLSRPEVIRQFLMNLICNNSAANTMLPSERELCRQFNVTRPTVRLAVKGLIQEGALEIRPGLGTFIIRENYNTDEYGMAYRNVAILTGDGRLATVDRFFWEIYAAAGTELVRNKVRIRPGFLLSDTKEDMLAELSRLKVDGIIWISPSMLEFPRALEEMGIPVLCVNRGIDDPALSCIYADTRQAGYDCGKLLLQQKRQNILHVQRNAFQRGELFLTGLTEAFSAGNIPFSRHLAIREQPGWQNRLEQFLNSRTKIDAIYADAILVSDILALLRNNAVPPPCIISEKHRLELSTELPPCIMLDLPLEKLGRTAAHRLLERLNGNISNRICESLPITIINHSTERE